MRTDTKTLIAAMRILSQDIESNDGIANAAIAEAADRMEELDRICNQIYVAENISLSKISFVSALAEIDKLYRTQGAS